MGMQKLPEFAQGCGVRYLGSLGKVQPQEGLHGVAVVYGILYPFIGELEPYLQHQHTQHHLYLLRGPAALSIREKGRTNSTHSFHGKTASIFVKKTSRLVTFRLLPYSKSVKLICFSISFTSLPYFTAISQKIKSVFTPSDSVLQQKTGKSRKSDIRWLPLDGIQSCRNAIK